MTTLSYEFNTQPVSSTYRIINNQIASATKENFTGQDKAYVVPSTKETWNTYGCDQMLLINTCHIC